MRSTPPRLGGVDPRGVGAERLMMSPAVQTLGAFNAAVFEAAVAYALCLGRHPSTEEEEENWWVVRKPCDVAERRARLREIRKGRVTAQGPSGRAGGGVSAHRQTRSGLGAAHAGARRPFRGV